MPEARCELRSPPSMILGNPSYHGVVN